MTSTMDAIVVGDRQSAAQSTGDRQPYDISDMGRNLTLFVPMETEDSSITEDDAEVVVNDQRKGLALLLGFENFKNGEKKRLGAKRDLEHMYQVFNHLPFEVQWRLDITSQECMDWIKQVTSDQELMNRVSCVVMVISSHGSEEMVKKDPEIHRDYKEEVTLYQHHFSTCDGTIKTSDIMDLFDDMKCRALKGKPKLFFIQACRSRTDRTTLQSVDRGVNIVINSNNSRTEHTETAPLDTQGFFHPQNETESQMDAKGYKPPVFDGSNCLMIDVTDRLPLASDKIDLAPPPCFYNCLTIMASPPGQVAWSENDSGGWLIFCLYQVFMNYIRKKHCIRVLRALTEISHMMALTMKSITDQFEFNNMKCVPILTHKLERDILIVPNNVP